MNYYDDNFGHWNDMDDPDMRDFYFQVQQTNVEKECTRCGQIVSIQPHYAICNSCMERMEWEGDW